MKYEEILEQLRILFDTTVGTDLFVPVNSIDTSDNLFDLGVDSLNIISIILRIEEFFSIEFDDEDLLIDNLKSLDLIIKLIISKGVNQHNDDRG